MTKLIGIFIPAYNAEKFLDSSIQSVINQTHQDWELLILDDASTDKTSNIVKKYMTDHRIRYVQNKQNLGMAGNWNKGISLLDNHYIAKLDADDFYEPQFLEHTFPVLDQNPNVGMVFTGLNWIVQNHQTISMLPYTNDWIVDGKIFRKNLVRQCVAYGPTIVARKECYDQLGSFIPEMCIHNDWEMWIRLSSHYDIAFVSKLLSNALRHSENITTAAREDTRTPDDFEIWLTRLDNASLPYELTEQERYSLEASMIEKILPLFFRSIRNANLNLAEVCMNFLCQRKQIPFYEKVRYKNAFSLLKRNKSFARHLTLGRGLTERFWNLNRWTSIKSPAKDPFDAIS